MPVIDALALDFVSSVTSTPFKDVFKETPALYPVVKVESAVSIERAFKGVVEVISTVELDPLSRKQTPQVVRLGMSRNSPS